MPLREITPAQTPPTVGEKLDRVMLVASYLYLLLPSLIFVLGWLRPLCGLPVGGVLVWGCVRCLRAEDGLQHPNALITRRALPKALAALAIFIGWFFLSGIGGFTFQTADHHWRNALFRDLVSCHWPLTYSVAGSGGPHMVGLVYYIGSWLPAALFGKLVGGVAAPAATMHAAHAALFGWSLLGGLCAVYLLFRYLGRVSLRVCLLFIFFSGLDALGWVLLGNGRPDPQLGIEWWARFIQYSSITTTLFWVFNQTIPIWVVLTLLLNQRRLDNYLWIFAMAWCQSVYPSLGLLPILACLAYGLARAPMQEAGTRAWQVCVRMARQLCTAQNVTAVLAMGGILGAYYTANHAANANSGWLYQVLAARGGSPVAVTLVLTLFCLLEFFLYLLLIYPRYRRNPLFMVVGLSLLLIPLYESGVYNDFAMRVSIPALFLTMLFIGETLLDDGFRRAHPWRTWTLVGLLLIGAQTSWLDIGRSLAYRADWPCWADALNSHNGPPAFPWHAPLMLTHRDQFSVYMVDIPDTTFFYRYLARPMPAGDEK